MVLVSRREARACPRCDPRRAPTGAPAPGRVVVAGSASSAFRRRDAARSGREPQARRSPSGRPQTATPAPAHIRTIHSHWLPAVQRRHLARRLRRPGRSLMNVSYAGRQLGDAAKSSRTSSAGAALARLTAHSCLRCWANVFEFEEWHARLGRAPGVRRGAIGPQSAPASVESSSDTPAIAFHASRRRRIVPSRAPRASAFACLE
jgi:hypothetical protein